MSLHPWLRQGPSQSSERTKASRQDILRVEEKTERSLFQGPLPPPEILEGYSRIPGAIKVILEMAERNQLARLKREEDEQKARLVFRENYLTKDFQERRLGQLFGFIVALIGLLGGFLLVYSGQVIPGVLVAFVSA